MELELILKYFDGKANAQEAMAIEEWTAADAANETMLQNLHQSWLATENNQYALPELEKAWEQFSKKIAANPTPSTPVKTNPMRFWMQSAAAVIFIGIIAVAGYFTFNRSNQNEPKLIAETTNTSQNVLLKDGSNVTLEAYSQLVYPKTFNDSERVVTLVGNARFNIAPADKRKFIIDLGKTTVAVLGTAFDISRDKSAITVNVKTGKVAFYNKKDTLLIDAGNIGKYIKSSEKFELVKITPAIPLTGSFEFNNESLNAVSQALAKHFQVQISFANPGLKNCKLSAGYTNLPLVQILDGITNTFEISYTIKQKTVIIDGKACQ